MEILGLATTLNAGVVVKQPVQTIYCHTKAIEHLHF